MLEHAEVSIWLKAPLCLQSESDRLDSLSRYSTFILFPQNMDAIVQISAFLLVFLYLPRQIEMSELN